MEYKKHKMIINYLKERENELPRTEVFANNKEIYIDFNKKLSLKFTFISDDYINNAVAYKIEQRDLDEQFKIINKKRGLTSFEYYDKKVKLEEGMSFQLMKNRVQLSTYRWENRERDKTEKTVTWVFSNSNHDCEAYGYFSLDQLFKLFKIIDKWSCDLSVWNEGKYLDLKETSVDNLKILNSHNNKEFNDIPIIEPKEEFMEDVIRENKEELRLEFEIKNLKEINKALEDRIKELEVQNKFINSSLRDFLKWAGITENQINKLAGISSHLLDIIKEQSKGI